MTETQARLAQLVDASRALLVRRTVRPALAAMRAVLLGRSSPA